MSTGFSQVGQVGRLMISLTQAAPVRENPSSDRTWSQDSAPDSDPDRVFTPTGQESELLEADPLSVDFVPEELEPVEPVEPESLDEDSDFFSAAAAFL